MDEKIALAWMNSDYDLLFNLLRELDAARAFRMGVRVYRIIEREFGAGERFAKWLEENI